MIATRNQVLWHAVALSAMLHLALLWGLRHHPDPDTAAVRAVTKPLEIKLIQPSLPLPRTEAPVSMPTPQRNSTPHKDVGAERAEGAARDMPHETEAPSQVLPFRPSADAMIEAAKRDIGKIDRELRQTNPPSALTQTSRPSSPLERGIAAAGLLRGTVMQEIDPGDGRRITKIVTSSSTYCVLGRKPGAGIAENELAGLTTTTCPN